MYDIKDIDSAESNIEFKKHQAIRQLIFTEDVFILQIDYSDPLLRGELDALIEKLKDTLALCVDVVAKCTPFALQQTKIGIEKI